MMNYELFKEVVTEKFKGFMPAEYADYKVDVHPVVKVNQTLESINLIPASNEKWMATPTIYINNMYEHYKQCEDLQEVLQSAAKAMLKAFKEAPKATPLAQLETEKDNIVMVQLNIKVIKVLIGLLE